MASTSVNVEQPPTSRKINVDINSLKENVKDWDVLLCFDGFYLFMTWMFLVCQEGKDVVFEANMFAWYVSLVFLLDLMFRLLSRKIESMNPEQWNHLWLCLFPVVFSILAASYDYDFAVYGSKPLQVWNALFYTCYMVGVVGCAVYRRFV